jgi:hypothetical protein
VLRELGADLLHRRIGLGAAANEEAQAQLTGLCVVVEREAGGVRAAMLTAVEHADERLADLGLRALALEQDSRYSAHGLVTSAGKTATSFTTKDTKEHEGKPDGSCPSCDLRVLRGR